MVVDLRLLVETVARVVVEPREVELVREWLAKEIMEGQTVAADLRVVAEAEAKGQSAATPLEALVAPVAQAPRQVFLVPLLLTLKGAQVEAVAKVQLIPKRARAEAVVHTAPQTLMVPPDSTVWVFFRLPLSQTGASRQRVVQ